MKISFLIIFLSAFGILQAQNFSGIVQNSENNEALEGAVVYWIPSKKGTITDKDGRFVLEKNAPSDQFMVISYLGFKSDSIPVSGIKNPLKIQLKPRVELNTANIESEREAYMKSIKTENVEIISSKALTKAACCNLSESFETNGTADVSYSDAVTGAKHIRLLGLDGKYVSITSENIPNIRGLANMYGMGFIPGPMIESIQISKGPSSVVNGYEGIAGQINVEYKKPCSTERLFVNVFANMMGRVEGNLNFSHRFNDTWSTLTMLHGNFFRTPTDRNKDGFLDMSFHQQMNALHRWKYVGKKFEFQLGAKAVFDKKEGGQNSFYNRKDTSNIAKYAFVFNTKRGEAFGKFGFMWPSKPFKSIGLIGNFTYHQQNAAFGLGRYNGLQRNGYFNGIYESILGNTNHKFRTGVSFLFDDYLESYNDTMLKRTELVPGAFFEYTFKYLEKFTLVAGVRDDYHNIFGNQITPRLHLKWSISEKLVFRASGGRGFRVANIFVENSTLFISSRKLIIQERLRPEIAWNFGGNLTYTFKMFDRKASLSGDFYRTDFQNQVMTDMDDAHFVKFYNLGGKSFSNAAQIDFNFMPFKRFNVRIVAKYSDVRADFAGKLLRVPFVPVYKGLINLEYETGKYGFVFDFTVQLNGPSRLPQTYDATTGAANRTESPVFPILLAQITKKFKNLDLYLGGENLGDYRQATPIIDAQNPFGAKFDASQVWAPVYGIMIYGGVRWKIPY